MQPDRRKLEESIVELIVEASTSLPGDVKEALERAASREESRLAKIVLNAYLENTNIAKRARLPLCQDTGIPEFYIWLGELFPYKEDLVKTLVRAVHTAVEHGYLRRNAYDPITGRELELSKAEGFPFIHIAGLIEGSDEALISLILTGGGAARPSFALTLDPLTPLSKITDMIEKAILEKAFRACPPLVIGVGLGSTIEVSALYSKLALLRPLGLRSKRREIAEIEEALVESLNRLGVGPQSVGGLATVLDVHLEVGASHPSSLAVAVSFSCWALRRVRARVSRSLDVEVIPYVYGRE